jgi:hypothetical protein
VARRSNPPAPGRNTANNFRLFVSTFWRTNRSRQESQRQDRTGSATRGACVRVTASLFAWPKGPHGPIPNTTRYVAPKFAYGGKHRTRGETSELHIPSRSASTWTCQSIRSWCCRSPRRSLLLKRATPRRSFIKTLDPSRTSSLDTCTVYLIPYIHPGWTSSASTPDPSLLADYASRITSDGFFPPFNHYIWTFRIQH